MWCFSQLPIINASAKFDQCMKRQMNEPGPGQCWCLCLALLLSHSAPSPRCHNTYHLLSFSQLPIINALAKFEQSMRGQMYKPGPSSHTDDAWCLQRYPHRCCSWFGWARTSQRTVKLKRSGDINGGYPTLVFCTPMRILSDVATPPLIRVVYRKLEHMHTANLVNYYFFFLSRVPVQNQASTEEECYGIVKPSHL